MAFAVGGTPRLLRCVARLARAALLRIQPRKRRTLGTVSINERADGKVEQEAHPEGGDERGNGGKDRAHVFTLLRFDHAGSKMTVFGGTGRAPRSDQASGFTSGNKIVSRMPSPVRAINSRSIPMPMPPDGGIAYSIAVRKSSSTAMASSSPAAASRA
jgi:hypothetical protein